MYDVTGEGIEIVLKDNQASVISANDILTLVNQLIISGAEAIAINDNRYNNNTDIVSVNSKEILVSSRRIVSPYVIKAIGNKKNLESSITIKERIYQSDACKSEKVLNISLVII